MKVIFVCWGNICRSPMAERVARAWAAREGMDGVTFSSAATSREELGRPMDPRARAVLDAHGYDSGGHRAHQISAAEVNAADLVIGMEDIHVAILRRLAPEAEHLALLTDFDPAVPPGTGVADPWYGDLDGFEDTLQVIEAAMPGLMNHLRASLR